jgi:hypothetical protein
MSLRNSATYPLGNAFIGTIIFVLHGKLQQMSSSRTALECETIKFALEIVFYCRAQHDRERVTRQKRQTRQQLLTFYKFENCINPINFDTIFRRCQVEVSDSIALASFRFVGFQICIELNIRIELFHGV